MVWWSALTGSLGRGLLIALETDSGFLLILNFLWVSISKAFCLWWVSGSWEQHMGTVVAQEDGWGTGGAEDPLPLAEPLSLGLDSHWGHPLRSWGLSSLSGPVLCSLYFHGRQCLFAWERLAWCSQVSLRVVSKRENILCKLRWFMLINII